MSLDFEITEAALMHGFAGYFECPLYKDIDISKWFIFKWTWKHIYYS